jgi:hypothetical protein
VQQLKEKTIVVSSARGSIAEYAAQRSVRTARKLFDGAVFPR